MADLPRTFCSELHYRLTSEEWATVWDTLKPAEIRILFHLRLLDPFGDRNLDIGVRELARTLNIDHSTVSRALKTLEAQGYIDLELLKVNVRIHSKTLAVVPEDNGGVSSHHLRSPRTTVDQQPPPQLELPEPEIPAVSDVQPFSTEVENVPEQTLKDSVNNKPGLTTVEINRENTGTSPLARMVPEQTGIPLNSALLAAISKIEEASPDEAYSRVSNAISAYLEQQDKVRNPQAFLNSAIQKGMTSNQAKKRARQTEKQERTNFPAPAMPKILDFSDLIAEIQIHCQRLNLSITEALERFGRAGRSLANLTDVDLATFRVELAGWT